MVVPTVGSGVSHRPLVCPVGHRAYRRDARSCGRRQCPVGAGARNQLVRHPAAVWPRRDPRLRRRTRTGLDVGQPQRRLRMDQRRRRCRCLADAQRAQQAALAADRSAGTGLRVPDGQPITLGQDRDDRRPFAAGRDAPQRTRLRAVADWHRRVSAWRAAVGCWTDRANRWHRTARRTQAQHRDARHPHGDRQRRHCVVWRVRDLRQGARAVRGRIPAPPHPKRDRSIEL